MLTIGAVILCGGESRRMGRPKAWLDFGPQTLLERVVRRVATVASPVIVAAAPGQPLPNMSGDVTVVRDRVAGRGPLAGMAAAFAALPQNVEAAYVTAVDAPLVEPKWIVRLAELIGDHALAIPLIDRHYYPLAALYRPAVVADAIARLLADGRGPVSLVDCLPTRTVTAAELHQVDPTLATLRNINTPKEYEQALRDTELA